MRHRNFASRTRWTCVAELVACGDNRSAYNSTVAFQKRVRARADRAAIWHQAVMTGTGNGQLVSQYLGRSANGRPRDVGHPALLDDHLSTRAQDLHGALRVS